MSDENSPVPKPNTKPDTSAASLLSAIPSIYYDLIARVCPGMAFLAAVYLTTTLRVKFDLPPVNDLSGPLLVVLLALSYVVGIALTGISIIWDLLSINGLCATRQSRQFFGLESATPSFFGRWATLSSRVDAVMSADSAAGRELSKMMAEVALCQNLFSAILLLYFTSCSEHVTVTFHIALTLVLLLTMVVRQGMFLGRVNSMYRIFVMQHTPS